MSNKAQEEQLKNYVEQIESPVGPPIEATNEPLPWNASQEKIELASQIGWQNIPIKDLPTKGLFYPEGTEVVIRAATTAEIRHWSGLQEENLSVLDDMLNYIIERCVSLKIPGPYSSWKDLKEIDRFYLLLAVREFTFIKGDNKLQVKISETKKMDVKKEMIDYITFDERLMKYYSDEKRCFLLKFKSGRILEISIPNIGVIQFLKHYMLRKQAMQENIDEDFVNFAPFVIKDWRGLSDSTYEKAVLDSTSWDNLQISMVSQIRQMFMDTINPVIKYKDEGGAELTAPLNFQGGIKSIFLISDPFAELV